MQIVPFPPPAPPSSPLPPDRDEVLLEIRDRVRSLDPTVSLERREFRSAMDEFIRDHGVTMRRPDAYAYMVPMLTRYFGGMMVDEIDVGTLRRFIAARLAEGATKSTVNRNRSTLSAFLNWAIDRKYALHNACMRVRRFKENPGRVRYLTKTEADRLLEAAKRTRGGHLYAFIFSALHTGGRRGELLSLKWSAVDLDVGTITFARELTKSSKTRVIPMVPQLVELFRDLRSAQRAIGGEQGYVFTYQGKRIESIGIGWRNLLADVGITDFRIHDLRHSFASAYMMNGGQLYALQVLLGHTDPKMTMRYSHLSREYLAAGAKYIGLPGAPCQPFKTIVVEPVKPPERLVIPAATVRLLRDLRDIFKQRKARCVPTREILADLTEKLGRHEFAGPIMSSCRTLAAMLRPLGIHSSQIEQNGGANTKGYRLGHLAPAFSRYLGDAGAPAFSR